jgi:hypothetical protein
MLVHEPQIAPNQIKFMTNISLLHVSVSGFYPQEVLQIKGIPGMTNTQFLYYNTVISC